MYSVVSHYTYTLFNLTHMFFLVTMSAQNPPNIKFAKVNRLLAMDNLSLSLLLASKDSLNENNN